VPPCGGKERRRGRDAATWRAFGVRAADNFLQRRARDRCSAWSMPSAARDRRHASPRRGARATASTLTRRAAPRQRASESQAVVTELSRR
jgi:hypothetical protein